MRILHLTDLHGNSKQLKNILSQSEFDLLVLSGDITHFGHFDDIEAIFEELVDYQQTILAVTGNCDYPECKDFLQSKGYLSENRIVNIQGIQYIGIGGSLKCPGRTPNEYTEEQYQENFNRINKSINPSEPLILISHQPPHKTKNDKVFPGLHVGSKSVRRFIEQHQPLVCLTGHIHEGKGTDFIGESIIINPGPTKNGHYAIIDIVGKTPPTISLF